MNINEVSNSRNKSSANTSPCLKCLKRARILEPRVDLGEAPPSPYTSPSSLLPPPPGVCRLR
jgi:hypothetical protein